MKQKSGPGKAPAEQVLKDIRRQTRRQYSAEEKIRIVLEGLRGGEYLRAVPPRGYRRLNVLRLVEGVPGGRQTPIGGRYGARRNLRRSEGPSPGGYRIEGGRGRSHPRESLA